MQTDDTGKLVERYETFCDAAYFDMWCVRKVGERTFGQGFHVINEASALELKAHLERKAAEIAELRASLRTAMNDLQAHKDALAQAEPKP